MNKASTSSDPNAANQILCLLSFGNDHAIEAKIRKGLECAVTERGYEPIFGIVPIDPRAEIRRLVAEHAGRLAGLAIQPFRPNKELAELLLSPPLKDIPYIIIGHYFYNLQINACVIDNFGGMFAATERLIQNGRRNLAYLGEISSSSTEMERFMGFMHACVRNGILVPSSFIINKYFEKDLRKICQQLFEHDSPPDGMVCLFDGLASMVLRVLRELKIRVPQDVSVISFGDDEDIANLCQPTLSTAFHPAADMGAVAAHQLINQIEGKIPSTPEVFVLPAGMHIRQSCGTPPDLLAEGKTFWALPFSEYAGSCMTLDKARELGKSQSDT